MKTAWWAFLLVFLGSIVSSVGPIFFKRASQKISLNIKKLLRNYDLFIAIAIYVGSTFFYIPALRGGDLSVLYPIVAMSYIFVSFVSMIFLKEKMTKLKWTGIFFIIVGIVFIGVGSV